MCDICSMLSHGSSYIFYCSAVSSSQFFFAGHQGSSQSDLCTNTGFGSFNSLYVMGTFMCPRNASTLRDGHIYVPSDPVQNRPVHKRKGISPEYIQCTQGGTYVDATCTEQLQPLY